jgi:hypothetical protein
MIADYSMLNPFPKRRVIFILCLPAAIYAEICMYYFGWRELMPALLKINIPFGFASIAGGINESRSVFLPMFGGPFIALMLAYIAAGKHNINITRLIRDVATGCFIPKLNSPSNIPETDIGLLFLRNSHSSWLSSTFLYSLI